MARPLPAIRLGGVVVTIVALAGCPYIPANAPEHDRDGDGVSIEAGDCDDSDPLRYPGATERCDADNVDEDCDGNANDADDDVVGTTAWYADADGDGFGSSTLVGTSCDAPNGTVDNGTDCDDTRADVHPGADEVCNGIDDDCDGGIDDADLQGAIDAHTYWPDVDGDAYGDDGADPIVTCAAMSADQADNADDCDDADDAIHPSAVEICDPGDADEDCNGLADDLDPGVTGQTDWYPDLDGDGYGDKRGTPTVSCEVQPNAAITHDDCDDTRGDVHPGAAEVCDSANVDENCNSLADDLDPNATGKTDWHLDIDRDGFGATAATVRCDSPGSSFLGDAGLDCDDTRANVHPGAIEVCDPLNLDEDCNTLADNADPDAVGRVVHWPDRDSDSYGDAHGASTTYCDPPANTSVDHTDCDDAHAAAHPGLTEICRDGLDNDCDGTPNQCVMPAAVDFSARPPSFIGKNAGALNSSALGDFDFNGDGTPDIAIGSIQDHTAGSNYGAVYVWYGPITDPLLGAPNVTIASDAGYATGADIRYLGSNLTSAGDVDSDGSDELVIAAPYGSGKGAVWRMRGGRTSTRRLVDATSTFTLVGEVDYAGGASLVGAGLAGGKDLTGNGVPDLAIGTQQGANWDASSVYLVDGTMSGAHSLSDAWWAATTLTSPDASRIGHSIAIGDLDGDGAADLLTTGDLSNVSRGRAWVILGPIAGGSQPLGATVGSGIADFMITEPAGDLGDSYGWKGALVDVNGDGHDDLAVSAKAHRPAHAYSLAGAVFVHEWPLSFNDTVETYDHVIYGIDNPNQRNSWLGWNVSAAGDVDGDGTGDLMASSPRFENPTGPSTWDNLPHGMVAIVTGAALADQGVAMDLQGALITPIAGVTLGFAPTNMEPEGVYLGNSMSTAGDVDGDGYADVLIGSASRRAVTGASAGATWLVFGMGL